LAGVEKRKYNDRRQYLIKAVHARRKKVRQMAVEYKGGKCEICGYYRCVDALEFHHNDFFEKRFGISEKGCTRSWKEVMGELDKCIMICANCHRELHAKLAASGGNAGVKSGLIQENRTVPVRRSSNVKAFERRRKVGGNPELGPSWSECRD
jgi:hypothetical protein